MHIVFNLAGHPAANTEVKQQPVAGNAMKPPASTLLLQRNHTRSVSCGALPTNVKRTESHSEVDESNSVVHQSQVSFLPHRFSNVIRDIISCG